MDQPDLTVAVNVVGAVLAGHFHDVGQSSPGWDLVDDSVYLAALTRRALVPLLLAQHRLVGAAEAALDSGDTSELRLALARMKALMYEPGSAVGEVVRLNIELAGDELATAWSGDVAPDVRNAVRGAALRLVNDDPERGTSTASFVQFTARRYGGTVEVDYDVHVASEPVGRSLQDFAAVAVVACGTGR